MSRDPWNERDAWCSRSLGAPRLARVDANLDNSIAKLNSKNSHTLITFSKHPTIERKL
jgi:hypothetical protein